MSRTALLAAALLALSVGQGYAQKRSFNIPGARGPEEEPVPDFKKTPSRRDLQSTVKHLGLLITAPGVSQDGLATIDQFLNDLEANLQKGNDVPRDRILRNAELARESLRLAYNDLAEAIAPETLQETRDKLKEISEELPPLLERNRASVEKLADVTNQARGTVGAMVLSPPESPGSPVPIATLANIEALRPELLELRKRLRVALAKLKKTKALVARAKERAAEVDGFAEGAQKLDEEALGHLNERRTRGVNAQYQTKMYSREVILNANKWLKSSVEKAEDVVRKMEDQVDPAKEGVRKALEDSFEADRKTMDGRELETRSGNRINYNHKMRLNDVIRHGWESASGQRRHWWVGRAQMARDEGVDDVGKMEAARDEAVEAGRAAERAAEVAARTMKRLDEAIGRSDRREPSLKRKVIDVPAPRDVKGKPKSGDSKVKSKPIKIPRTLEVTDDEIIHSYDH